MYHKLILLYMICKGSKLLVTIIFLCKLYPRHEILCKYFTLELQKETECIINNQHYVQQRRACLRIAQRRLHCIFSDFCTTVYCNKAPEQMFLQGFDTTVYFVHYIPLFSQGIIAKKIKLSKTAARYSKST